MTETLKVMDSIMPLELWGITIGLIIGYLTILSLMLLTDLFDK
jgi:hypothetical protein